MKNLKELVCPHCYSRTHWEQAWQYGKCRKCVDSNSDKVTPLWSKDEKVIIRITNMHGTKGLGFIYGATLDHDPSSEQVRFVKSIISDLLHQHEDQMYRHFWQGNWEEGFFIEFWSSEDKVLHFAVILEQAGFTIRHEH